MVRPSLLDIHADVLRDLAAVPSGPNVGRHLLAGVELAASRLAGLGLSDLRARPRSSSRCWRRCGPGSTQGFLQRFAHCWRRASTGSGPPYGVCCDARVGARGARFSVQAPGDRDTPPLRRPHARVPYSGELGSRRPAGHNALGTPCATATGVR